MRRTLIVVAAVAVTALAVTALAWALPRSADEDASNATARSAREDSSTLAARTADAGGVEVTVTPVRVERDGALFDVAFDTHTVDLDIAPDRSAALTVGATTWKPARWRGDPAGGHHRGGQLSFTAQGPATGSVRLSIADLPTPVTFEWELTRS